MPCVTVAGNSLLDPLHVERYYPSGWGVPRRATYTAATLCLAAMSFDLSRIAGMVSLEERRCAP
jgi:hypothetical protein